MVEATFSLINGVLNFLLFILRAKIFCLVGGLARWFRVLAAKLDKMGFDFQNPKMKGEQLLPLTSACLLPRHVTR